MGPLILDHGFGGHVIGSRP